MAWAAQNAHNENHNEQPRKVNTPAANHASCSMPEDELAKASAVADELIRIGANIAESYSDYLQLGFSLANGLGSEGRDIYHRLCSQSAKYREADCERKWQECLTKNDGRTTIATFYNMAKEAGVDLSEICKQFPSLSANPHVDMMAARRGENLTGNGSYLTDNKNNTCMKTAQKTTLSGSLNNHEDLRNLRESAPSADDYEEESLLSYKETFSDKIRLEDLPALIRFVAETQNEPEDRDKVILSSITIYSGNIPNVYGIYGKKSVLPPLYLIISAPSGALKGIIAACSQLLMPIEYELKKQNEQALEEYHMDLAKYNAMSKKEQARATKPEEPKRRSLFVSANSSATSLYEDLADNDERGTIFESEADTMTQAISQDYGNYSDGLRKAFHGERISYSRRKEKEHVCLESPSLAIQMTCTPMQITRLLPANEVENGLANRFLFYSLKGGRGWINPFVTCEQTIESQIYRIGELFKKLYEELNLIGNRKIQVVLTMEQQKAFNDYFSPLLLEQTGMHGEMLDAFIFRLGLSAFRMMMVFTVLRCYEHQPMIDPNEQALSCSDMDFHTVMTIVNCLVNHTIHVFTHLLPHATFENPHVAALSSQEKTLYNTLGDEFTTQEAYTTANNLGITQKTAERYLGKYVSQMVARRIRNGCYCKIVPPKGNA